ncbi:hypothetical protein FRC05_009100 [Tulasnella sp. 425]|nr:hypothetical protein FRC05_009100 [Tulasnella sp. 425]
MTSQIMDAADQSAFAPYPGFDSFDPMKRAHESTGVLDSNKKARVTTPRSFENYGYGPGVANTLTPMNAANALYSTGGAANGAANGLNGNGLTLNTNFSGLAVNGLMGNGSLSAGANGGQSSPSFPPSPNMSAETPINGPYSAMASLGAGYGMGFNGLMGMNGMNFNAFGGLNSPSVYAVSPTVGGFGSQQTALGAGRGYGNTAQNAAVAAAAAAAAAANNQTGRTVYIGNLPADASVDELLNLVHFGPLESVRVLPEKSCVFISFLDGATAAAFHADATIKKLALHGNELKIGWGKASPVPSQVLQSIQQSNASRNVYLGGLDEGMTEEQLRDDLSRFGLIDQVKIVRDKNIGFVHFLNISTATKVVATLPTEPAWAGKRVNYGKDRCAYVPKNQHTGFQTNNGFAPFSPMPNQSFGMSSPVSATFGNLGVNTAMANTGFAADGTPTSPGFPMGMGMGMGMAANGAPNMNRTVYLGNIHPETNIEDLCNAIRGGILQSIRYMHDKHIAFVTFVDPNAAFTFYQVATYQGLTLNNRRLKIGWGKNPGPISPSLNMSVSNGATRNVYIGNIEDFEIFNEDKLKRDFGEYGEIELVNFLKEKNCAFVNFTNIANAIKAIEGIKTKPEYTNLRIAHGKDRCANPPRSGPQGGAGGRRAMAIPSAFGNGLDGQNGGFEVHVADGDMAEGVPTVTVNGADEEQAQA